VLANLSTRLESEDFILPQGYSIEIGGESAERDSAVGNLMTSCTRHISSTTIMTVGGCLGFIIEGVNSLIQKLIM